MQSSALSSNLATDAPAAMGISPRTRVSASSSVSSFFVCFFMCFLLSCFLCFRFCSEGVGPARSRNKQGCDLIGRSRYSCAMHRGPGVSMPGLGKRCRSVFWLMRFRVPLRDAAPDSQPSQVSPMTGLRRGGQAPAHTASGKAPDSHRLPLCPPPAFGGGQSASRIQFSYAAAGGRSVCPPRIPRL